MTHQGNIFSWEGHAGPRGWSLHRTSQAAREGASLHAAVHAPARVGSPSRQAHIANTLPHPEQRPFHVPKPKSWNLFSLAPSAHPVERDAKADFWGGGAAAGLTRRVPQDPLAVTITPLPAASAPLHTRPPLSVGPPTCRDPIFSPPPPTFLEIKVSEKIFHHRLKQYTLPPSHPPTPQPNPLYSSRRPFVSWVGSLRRATEI